MRARRELSFDRLDQVMPEVERLLEGHVATGRWDLAQICQHLAKALRSVIDPDDLELPPWILRVLIGPLIFRRVLKTGRMVNGVRAPKAMVPDSGLDARAEAEALREAIRYFEERLPESMDHPFFGRATAAEIRRLHCIHCAHHLSFVHPAPQPGGGQHVETDSAAAGGP
jgi:hypothetical protein